MEKTVDVCCMPPQYSTQSTHLSPKDPLMFPHHLPFQADTLTLA